MKIFAFADVHGDAEHLAHVIKAIKEIKPDLVISAGDHTWFQDKENEILKSFDLGPKVLVVPGNHEHPEATKKTSKKMKHIVNLHQGVFEKDGVLFVGCGEGGFCCGNNDFENSKVFLAKNLKKHKGRTVLVTHEPPYGTKADEVSIGEHVGSKSLRDFIKENQPSMNICGHIHDSAGKMSKLGNTVVINAGPRGKTIEI